MLPLFQQVYTDGIRHIRADKRVNEWKTPGKKTIVKCAVNERQVSEPEIVVTRRLGVPCLSNSSPDDELGEGS